MSKLIPTYVEQGLRIEQLERELAEVNKALRIAVGLLSTYPKLSSEHPEYTLEYILNIAAMKEGE
jgi:hypothetical protein